ncbi:MAG: hypothetical protein PHT33_00085 [bacterium]|nr:hypothetical protein [bacterium]
MLDIAAAAALIIASFGPGFLVTERLLRERTPTLLTVVYSSAVGFGIFIYILLGMSYAGVLTASAIRAITLILIPVTCILLLRKGKKGLLSGGFSLQPSAFSLPPIVIWGALILLLLSMALNLLAALSPSLYWDELSYHLPLSRDYLAHGSMISHNFMPHSYMPEGAELLFSAGMALGSDKVPNLLHFYFGILLAAAIIAFAVKAGRPRAGILGAAFFYTMPVVTWLSPLAYIDLIAGLFSFLALLSAVNALEEHNEELSTDKPHKRTSTLCAFVPLCLPRRSPWAKGGLCALPEKLSKRWLLCGLLSGFAVSVKYSAGILPALILIFLLFKLFRHRTRAASIPLLAFFIPLTLLTLPWMARSYFLTGTPLWPYLSLLINDPFTANEAEIFRRTFAGFSQASRTLAGFLLLPFNAVFSSRQYDASIGPALLAFVPGYLILRRAKLLSVTIMLAFASAFTVMWYFSGPQMRFAIPALAVFSLAAGLSASTLLKTSSLRTVAGMIILLALAANFFYTGCHARETAQLSRLDKAKIGLGLISDDDYYNCLDIYRVASYANKHVQPEERILAINENRGYFYKSEFIWLADWLVIQGLSAMPDADYLLKKNIKWIIVTGMPEAQAKWLMDGVTTERLRVEYSSGSVTLLHILR